MVFDPNWNDLFQTDPCSSKDRSHPVQNGGWPQNWQCRGLDPIALIWMIW